MSTKLRITSLTTLSGVVMALVAMSGCGEAKLPVVPVAGKVTFQGQPAAGAQIVLHPVNSGSEQVFSATGRAQSDGSFKIGVHKEGDGAPPGEYIATVQWFKVVQNEGGSGQGPNVLPRIYSDPKNSPLKVTVQNAPTDLAPFDLQ